MGSKETGYASVREEGGISSTHVPADYGDLRLWSLTACASGCKTRAGSWGVVAPAPHVLAAPGPASNRDVLEPDLVHGVGGHFGNR